MHIFNVLEAQERIMCMDMMEKDITGPGAENRDRYLVIMGGDGSLATTLGMLRARPNIEDALRKKNVSFVTLPFGTGCDAAQVFGWGNMPQDEDWLARIEALMTDIVCSEQDTLSLWRITLNTLKS